MGVSLDLANHNARPAMVVRSQVHVLPREILGVSTFGVAMALMRWLPLWLVDKLMLFMAWIMFGNTSKYGLNRPEMGPMEFKNEAGKTPVLDVGALAKIRNGEIEIMLYIARILMLFRDKEGTSLTQVRRLGGSSSITCHPIKCSCNEFQSLKLRGGHLSFRMQMGRKGTRKKESQRGKGSNKKRDTYKDSTPKSLSYLPGNNCIDFIDLNKVLRRKDDGPLKIGLNSNVGTSNDKKSATIPTIDGNIDSSGSEPMVVPSLTSNNDIIQLSEMMPMQIINSNTLNSVIKSSEKSPHLPSQDIEVEELGNEFVDSLGFIGNLEHLASQAQSRHNISSSHSSSSSCQPTRPFQLPPNSKVVTEGNELNESYDKSVSPQSYDGSGKKNSPTNMTSYQRLNDSSNLEYDAIDSNIELAMNDNNPQVEPSDQGDFNLTSSKRQRNQAFAAVDGVQTVKRKRAENNTSKKVCPYMASLPNKRAVCILCDFFRRKKEESEGRDMESYTSKTIKDTSDSIDKHCGKYYTGLGYQWRTADCNTHQENEQMYEDLRRAGKLTMKNMQIVELDKEFQRNFECNTQHAKMIQFLIIFEILKSGRAMSAYGDFKSVLERANIQLPIQHWSETSAWDIAENISEVELDILRKKIERAKFISVSLDEVTAVDSTQWVCVHIYIVEQHQRVPHFLDIKRMRGGSNAFELKNVINNALKDVAGMSDREIGRKLVCIAADGASVMQGRQSGVIERFRSSHAPFCEGVSCTSHRLNLAYRTLNRDPYISKVALLVKKVHKYFSKSNKRYETFFLFSIGVSEVKRLLRNVETRWISLLQPCKRVFDMYAALVGFFSEEVKKDFNNYKASEVLDLLIDFRVLLVLAGIIPALEKMHTLVLYTQRRDATFHDFNIQQRTTNVALNTLYGIMTSAAQEYIKCVIGDDASQGVWPFSGKDFAQWLSVSTIQDLIEGRGYLKIDAEGELYVFVKPECMVKLTDKRAFVKQGSLETIISEVKVDLNKVVCNMVDEIRDRFPLNDLLTAMSMCSPKFWLPSLSSPLTETQQYQGIRSSFCKSLEVLKNLFGIAKIAYNEMVEADNQPFNALLDPEALDLEASDFCKYMAAWVRRLTEMNEGKLPSMNVLWSKVENASCINKSVSEYLKLFELVTCMPLGSVEDERLFSALSFVKSKHRNRLDGHLKECLRIKVSKHTNKTFPFFKAIDLWKSKMDRRGATSVSQPSTSTSDGDADDPNYASVDSVFNSAF